jgi:DNA-binding transcriptional LysR family regulator
MVEPFPRALGEFARKHPQVRWTLHEMTPAAQLQALKERRLDVCFFRVSHEDPEIRSEVVMRESALVALPLSHPFAGREEIALRELETERFLSFGLLQSQLARFLRDCCVEAGFTPRIEQEVVELHTLLCLVREGLGIALLPSSAQQLSSGGVAFVPLSAPRPEVSLHARYRAEAPSPVLLLFLDTVRAAATSATPAAQG